MLNHPRQMKRQLGLTLIESLISLLVISIGLLGIAALQITSLKQTSSSQWHSAAGWYNYEITDRILANTAAFNQYNGIDTNNDYDMNCQASECTPAQMVVADAQEWKQMVSNLPEGRGFISSPAPNTLTVSVYWNDDSDESNCINGEPDADGKTCYTVTMTTVP